jgi:3-oxoacyl-[acyl-carrier protein] reductase
VPVGPTNDSPGTTVLVEMNREFGVRMTAALARGGTTAVVASDGRDGADLEDPAAVRELFATVAADRPLSTIVLLACPAEALSPAELRAMDDAAWDCACERPLRVAVNVFAAAYEHLARSRGRMVVVCPTTGLQGATNFVALSALSEGLRILAKSAARQWAVDGIAVNIVAPSAGALRTTPDDGGWADALRGRVPGDGSYDVDAALTAVLSFLTASDARHLVGVTIPVDSGQVTAL